MFAFEPSLLPSVKKGEKDLYAMEEIFCRKALGKKNCKTDKNPEINFFKPSVSIFFLWEVV